MSRRLATITFAVAGLSWTVGQAVLPDMGLKTEERYDQVADAPVLESLSGGLLVLAGALLVLAAVTLSNRLASLDTVRGGRALALGTALTALGGVWLVGGRGAFNLMFVRLVEPDNVGRAEAVRLLDAGAGLGFVPLLLTLPALLVGPVVLGVGLRRAGLAGWWPVGFWVAGIGGFLVAEFTSKPAEVAGIAVASAALVWMGRSVDRAVSLTAGARGTLDRWPTHDPMRS